MTYEARLLPMADLKALAEYYPEAEFLSKCPWQQVVAVQSGDHNVGVMAFLAADGFGVALEAGNFETMLAAARPLDPILSPQTLHLLAMFIEDEHRNTAAFPTLFELSRKLLQEHVQTGTAFDYVTAVPTTDEEMENLKLIGFEPHEMFDNVYIISASAFIGFGV